MLKAVGVHYERGSLFMKKGHWVVTCVLTIEGRKMIHNEYFEEYGQALEWAKEKGWDE